MNTFVVLVRTQMQSVLTIMATETEKQQNKGETSHNRMEIANGERRTTALSQ